jgi:hypothetical protein
MPAIRGVGGPRADKTSEESEEDRAERDCAHRAQCDTVAESTHQHRAGRGTQRDVGSVRVANAAHHAGPLNDPDEGCNSTAPQRALAPCHLPRPPPSMSSLVSSHEVDFLPSYFGFPVETDFPRPEPLPPLAGWPQWRVSQRRLARCSCLGTHRALPVSPPGLFGSQTNSGLATSRPGRGAHHGRIHFHGGASQD